MSLFTAPAELLRRALTGPIPRPAIDDADLTGMSGEQMFGNAVPRQAMRRAFSAKAMSRAFADRLYRDFGADDAREGLDAAQDQIRAREREARDHAQTVRLAQAEAEVGL